MLLTYLLGEQGLTSYILCTLHALPLIKTCLEKNQAENLSLVKGQSGSLVKEEKAGADQTKLTATNASRSTLIKKELGKNNLLLPKKKSPSSVGRAFKLSNETNMICHLKLIYFLCLHVAGM